MIERLFKLSEKKTDARTEALAGLTTFLTMAYIIFVQPAVLSGKMFGIDTGMDFGAVTNGNVSFSSARNDDHGALRALPDRSSSWDG